MYNTLAVEKHGLVAQLGAHHIRIVGVVSSNLIKSTRFTAILRDGGVFIPRRISLAGDNFIVHPRRRGWSHPLIGHNPIDRI